MAADPSGMRSQRGRRRDTLPPRPSKLPSQPPAYRSRYSVSQACVVATPLLAQAAPPPKDEDELQYLHEFRSRAHSKVLIRRGRVPEETVDTLGELPSENRVLVLNAVTLGVLTQEEAFVKARQLVELHKSDNSEALASLLQELETQCEEARLHPVVRVVKPVSAAPDDIDCLDNDQRRAVMASVANGALPATEALGLMEQFLDVELNRRPLTLAEVGQGLVLESDASVDEARSPRPGRRRRTLFGGRRRSSTATSSSPKAATSADDDDKGGVVDDFYTAAAALDDEQRKAVLQSVANGSLSQGEALELVRQFIAANRPEEEEEPAEFRSGATPTRSKRAGPQRSVKDESVRLEQSDDEAPLMERDFYDSDSTDDSD